MLASEIFEYAELSDDEMRQAKEIYEKFTKGWNTGKNQFWYGIIATLGYIKKNQK